MTFQHYPLELAIVDLRSIKNMVDMHHKWCKRDFDYTDNTHDKVCTAKVLIEVDEIRAYVDSILKGAEERIVLDANEKVMRMK